MNDHCSRKGEKRSRGILDWAVKASDKLSEASRTTLATPFPKKHNTHVKQNQILFFECRKNTSLELVL